MCSEKGLSCLIKRHSVCISDLKSHPGDESLSIDLAMLWDFGSLEEDAQGGGSPPSGSAACGCKSICYVKAPRLFFEAAKTEESLMS